MAGAKRHYIPGQIWHITHLLVLDDRDRVSILRAIQLTAGPIVQEYNQRKKRKGAYWEDRYHATAIERGEHLLRCIVYIDLNISVSPPTTLIAL